MRLLFLLGLVALIGCSDVTRLTDKKYDPKPKDYPIEIYYDQAPTRPFERLAILREASEWTTAGEKLIAALKKRAREVGADAILLRGVGTQSTQGPAYVQTVGNTAVVSQYNGVKGTAEAIAIRWIGVPAAPPAPISTATPPTPVAGPITAAVGLHTWQLTINSNPQGALIQAYDSNQALMQLGRTPAILVWPIQTPIDTMILFWQGRQIAILPAQSGQGVYVDFMKQPPELSGATLVTPGR